MLAGHDSRPGNGSLITAEWQAGWRVLDEYQIQLPADLPSGEYGLRIGLYQDDGSALPVDWRGHQIRNVLQLKSSEKRYDCPNQRT